MGKASKGAVSEPIGVYRSTNYRIITSRPGSKFVTEV